MTILRITVEEIATGETQTVEVPDNEYFIITTGDCHVSHTQAYPTKGTHVLTIKGQQARRS